MTSNIVNIDLFSLIATAPERRLTKSEEKKAKDDNKKIRYAKEFFVTEKGEVIKMGAIITPNPHVRGALLLEK